jgi:hypothetical protein
MWRLPSASMRESWPANQPAILNVTHSRVTKAAHAGVAPHPSVIPSLDSSARQPSKQPPLRRLAMRSDAAVRGVLSSRLRPCG